MAVYSKLLLSCGGGITYTGRRAPQPENAATLCIGLGGIGINCLRAIKTQVYSQLEPDDLNAAEPRYDHIRFLGADSDISNIKGGNRPDSATPLHDAEYFSIASPVIAVPPKGKELPEELSWLRWEDIAPTDWTITALWLSVR